MMTKILCRGIQLCFPKIMGMVQIMVKLKMEKYPVVVVSIVLSWILIFLEETLCFYLRKKIYYTIKKQYLIDLIVTRYVCLTLQYLCWRRKCKVIAFPCVTCVTCVTIGMCN